MIYGIHVLATGMQYCLPESIAAVKEQVKSLGHWPLIQVSIPEVTWRNEPTAGPAQDRLLDYCDAHGLLLDRRRPLVNSGMSPRAAQAAFRQYAIDMLRDRGVDRVLIVDPDELWMPGALQHIEDMIACTAGLDAFFLRPVPVIGVPGLPVRGSRDWALVYVSRFARLVYARSFKAPGKTTTVHWIADPLDSKRLWHFTGTRERIADITAKFRASSHYGEEGYFIESWLTDVLPYLAPGQRDVSFYSGPGFPDGNPWPEVGTFTPQEWASLPDSLKSYLTPPMV